MNQKLPGGNLNAEVIDLNTHVRIEYKDVINFNNQMRLADSVYDLFVSSGKSKFIVNTKGCPTQFSVFERFEVAAYLAKKFLNNVTIAYIIDKENLFGIAENTARNRGGAGVRIVTTEEDALAWIEKR